MHPARCRFPPGARCRHCRRLPNTNMPYLTPSNRPCIARGCAGQAGGSCAAADGATEAHR